MIVGDTVRVVEELIWNLLQPPFIVPKGEIVKVEKVEFGSIWFKYKEKFIVAMPSDVELIQEELDVTLKPCSCSSRTIFDKGCQCGGI